MTLGSIVCSSNDKPYYDNNYMSEVKHRRRFRPRCIIVLAISALSALSYHHSALADTLYSSFNNNFSNHYSSNSPVDFSLSFSRADLDLESGNVVYPTTQNRISAIWVNRISANLNIGLIIGTNYISLDNDAATAGLSLNGNHIGFSVNEIFGNNLQIGLRAYYIYQQATGENTLRTASLTWHEWLAEATLRLRLGKHWAIIAGGGLTGLNVDRRVKGDINETIRMELANDVQGRIAVEILTAPADRIRLTLNRGAFDGFQLTFAHAF